MGKTNFNKNKKQMQAQTLINLMNQLTSNATLSAIPRNMKDEGKDEGKDETVEGCPLKHFEPCGHLASDETMVKFLHCARHLVTPGTPCHDLFHKVRKHYRATGETPF